MVEATLDLSERVPRSVGDRSMRALFSWYGSSVITMLSLSVGLESDVNCRERGNCFAFGLFLGCVFRFRRMCAEHRCSSLLRPDTLSSHHRRASPREVLSEDTCMALYHSTLSDLFHSTFNIQWKTFTDSLIPVTSISTNSRLAVSNGDV